MNLWNHFFYKISKSKRFEANLIFILKNSLLDNAHISFTDDLEGCIDVKRNDPYFTITMHKMFESLMQNLTLKYVRVFCSKYIKVVNQKSKIDVIEFEKRYNDDMNVYSCIYAGTFDT